MSAVDEDDRRDCDEHVRTGFVLGGFSGCNYSDHIVVDALSAFDQLSGVLYAKKS